MIKMTSKLIALCLFVLIFGCAPRYACKEMMPDAKCMSLSETYAQEILGEKRAEIESEVNIDDKRDFRFFSSENANAALIVESPSKPVTDKSSALKIGNDEVKKEKTITKDIQSSDKSIPILRPPKIARIWLAPWIDGSGDLHMESFIYTEIEGKKWVIGDMPDGANENSEKSYNPLK